MKGCIFDIQHYAVHDGPGIRTLVFLKGCPLKCSWCCNPESQSSSLQLRYISELCRFCGKCMEVCKVRMPGTMEDRRYPSEVTCDQCEDKACIEACNYGALVLAGRMMSAGEVAEIATRDLSFYRNSGGGVTLSGGEPLAQADFSASLLRKLQAAGVHTAVETSGYGAGGSMEKLIPYTDLFLFDLKLVDPDKHLRHTGRRNGPVLQNLALLAAEGCEVIIRLPLVENITDTEENLNGIATLMLNHRLEVIHLEPYHSLGLSKYRELGIVPRFEGKDYPAKKAETMLSFFTERGFRCAIP